MSPDGREGLHNDTSSYQGELEEALRARIVRGRRGTSSERGAGLREVMEMEKSVERNGGRIKRGERKDRVCGRKGEKNWHSEETNQLNNEEKL